MKETIMLNPFEKETIYIRVFVNKIELRHLDKDLTIVRSCVNHFSNERLLIANVSNAITFIKSILDEIYKKQLLKSTLVVLIQPVERIEGGVSEVEKMILNDLVEQIGGRYSFIHDSPEKLSDKQVRRITRT